MNVEELVSALTLEEKAGLCSGADFWHTKAVERLGIPAIKVSDGPHGLRTQKEGSTDPNDAIEAVCFPAGCAAAASFDPALTRRMGAALGREARASGVQVLLGPAVNIKRSPLCGRNFEYFSEDPLLSGQMAAAITRGVQSCPGCGVTLKHFACNNQETERLESNSLVSERALREIYLRGFQIAVQSAQPSAIMTSYNLVNGVHAANSAALCTAIARCEWGFAGIFMTDWDTTSSRRCTAEGCIQAGNDLLMPGSRREYSALLCALRDGRLDRRLLRSCAGRIIKTALGLSAPTAP